MTSDAPKSPDPIPEGPAGMPRDDRVAEALRGFGPLGILAMVVILLAGNDGGIPLGAILALVWARWSRTPWRELGFVRPKSWLRTVAVSTVFGCAFKLVMKTMVMPLLGADPVNHAYHYLVGNQAAVPGAIWAMVAGAGFGEETSFRGYMFERLGKLLGHGAWAKVLIVLFTAAVFGMAHYAGQGLAGAQQAVVTGLVFGTIMAITGRIWMLMVAHAAFDLTALWIIYWDLETQVAHFVFK